MFEYNTNDDLVNELVVIIKDEKIYKHILKCACRCNFVLNKKAIGMKIRTY